jgi:hypothetical protein
MRSSKCVIFLSAIHASVFSFRRARTVTLMLTAATAISAKGIHSKLAPSAGVELTFGVDSCVEEFTGVAVAVGLAFGVGGALGVGEGVGAGVFAGEGQPKQYTLPSIEPTITLPSATAGVDNTESPVV